MHGNAADMAVFQRLAQCFQGEVLGTLSGIKCTDAQIDSIGTILHCGTQCIHRTGGG